MKAKFIFHQLLFKKASGTSRGVLKTKDSWFLILTNEDNTGIGECSVIYGLNPETKSIVESKINTLCDLINNDKSIPPDFFTNCPSVRFAYEMAMQDLSLNTSMHLFDSDFIKGKPIPINGLVWMGDKQYMFDQVKDKIDEGFDCIKLKIGAIDFDDELEIIKYIRSQFSKEQIEIRVDANGAFEMKDALTKLTRLSQYELHSIEQPIPKGMLEEMATLCEKSPLPIALDEELIGIETLEEKKQILEKINPQYIILKPSLTGGFKKSEEWIAVAEENNIAWWSTSALESNVGLNAIAQWTSTLNNNMYQGLGTGQLFSNNIPSPLSISDGSLHYKGSWDLSKLMS